MPRIQKTLRLAYDNTYDIVFIRDIEKVFIEDREYTYRTTIIYTPKDDNKSKVKVI